MEKHHAAFDRVSWAASQSGKIIRNNVWLQPKLEREPHAELHRIVALVPVMGKHTMQLVARDFHAVQGDYVKSIEELMFTIEEAVQHPRTTKLEKDLSELTVHAFELQLPFIKEAHGTY